MPEDNTNIPQDASQNPSANNIPHPPKAVMEHTPTLPKAQPISTSQNTQTAAPKVSIDLPKAAAAPKAAFDLPKSSPVAAPKPRISAAPIPPQPIASKSDSVSVGAIIIDVAAAAVAVAFAVMIVLDI